MKSVTTAILVIGISGILCAILDIEYHVFPGILWGIGALAGFLVGLFANEE